MGFSTIFSNFQSILGKIAQGEKLVEPVVEKFVPTSIPYFAIIDEIFAVVPQSVIKQEMMVVKTGTEPVGETRQNNVIADFTTGLSKFNEILAIDKKKLQFNNDELKASIADFASAFTHLAAVKASIKIVDLGT